jgi:transposase
MYHVLDLLAQIAPDWLKAQVEADWYHRYSQRFSNYRFPKSESEKLSLAEVIGRDGFHLLQKIYSEDAPAFLCKIPVVETLRRVWLQNYYEEGDKVHWRTEGNLPPASKMIISPYDEEAHFSTKREMYWYGYKVHLTETCEQDTPNLITHVETTSSTEQDNQALDKIHAALQSKHLLPCQHVVDAGYVSGENLVNSRKDYQVDLLGPIRSDNSWQAREIGAFDITQFQIDWENQTITCPMGKTSSNWGPGKGPRDKPTIQVQFRKKDCFVCKVRQQCTRSKTAARCLTLHPQEQQLAVQAARQRQKTEVFGKQYAIRSGIEGTIGQAADKLGMRRSRYRGLIKTHLHHVLTATAINLKRVLDWLADMYRSCTRFSHFAALVPL